MVRVLVVGQTPPPHRGAALMLDFLVRSHMPDVDLRFLRIQLSADDSEAGTFRWTKLFRLFLFILRVIYCRLIFRSQILYCPPAGFPRSTVLRDVAILAATRPFFSKTVLHIHSCGCRKDYEQMPRWQRWLFRRGIFKADGVIRLSLAAPDNGENLDARKEYVVPNAVSDPFSEMLPSRTTVDVSNSGVLRVLLVSYLSESKGVLVAVEACGKLAARGVLFQLKIVGPFESDTFAAKVRSRVAELKIEDRVQFVGLVTGKQKHDIFTEADVFCFPTFFKYEAFPVVLLEAMAAGLPVVSTHHSGVPAIVDDGKTGFLVEPHDPDAVADRLTRLAHDVELRDEMAAAGREKFLREFTLSRHLDRMRDVFLDVAGVSRAEAHREPAPHRSRREPFAETAMSV